MNLAPDRQRRQSIRALSVLTFFLFLAYMFLIWIPEIEHYYVPSETVSEAMTEQGRKVPSDRVLDELRSHRLLEHGWQNNAQLVDSAEKLLKGTVDIPGLPSMEVHLPFDPADLDRGTGQWQLHFSALVVPEILIDAYRLTGREEFYAMARDVILAWAAYEKSAWFNRGFLWNDHAVANRVRILADFWSIYRHRPDYRPEVARQIWQFAARTGAMAAKPDQYTFATNHGVMQNLSLWQVCIAFPFLSRVEQYKQLALARLKDEMGFYISPDGVVLEGSADYHEFGLFLLGAALRYSTLLGLDVPPEWAQKYQRAKQFSEEIRRPDGSLPRYGDTAGGTHHAFAPVTEINGKGEFTRLMKANEELHPDPFALYPASGYAVSWNGLNDHENRSFLSQTVVAWSYFPGHGHEHADEPSVLLWAGGQDWWTNIGYWRYDDPDREHAECWEGSNAPHLVAETCTPNRTTSLLSAVQSSNLFATETERFGPGSLRIRRLLVQVPPSVWIIIDNCTGVSQASLQTIWTTASNVDLKPAGPPGAYQLSAPGVEGGFRAYFLGPAGLEIQSFRGSRQPFAGWNFFNGKAMASSAIATVQSGSGAWAATIWVLDKNLGVRERERASAAAEWRDASSWSIHVPLPSRTQLISRRGEKISVEGGSFSAHTAVVETLKPPPASAASEIAALRANYDIAFARYPRFKDLFFYRLRASKVGLALIVLQELFLALYERLRSEHLLALRVLACLSWIALTIWVPFFYLRTF